LPLLTGSKPSPGVGAGEGNGAGCLAEVEIDTGKLEACTAAADEEFSITANLEDKDSWLSGRFPMFNTDALKAQLYGVQGSPTLIINGAQSNAGRDSASYFEAICDAFNDAPEECDAELTSESPSPGFGWSESGSGSDATCG